MVKSFKIQFHNLKVGVVKKKAEVSVKLKGDPKGTKVIPEIVYKGTFSIPQALKMQFLVRDVIFYIG